MSCLWMSPEPEADRPVGGLELAPSLNRKAIKEVEMSRRQNRPSAEISIGCGERLWALFFKGASAGALE